MGAMGKLVYRGELEGLDEASLLERLEAAEAAARAAGYSLREWLQGELGETATEQVEAYLKERLGDSLDVESLKTWYERFEGMLADADRMRERLWQPVGELTESYQWSPSVPDEGFSADVGAANLSLKPGLSVSVGARHDPDELHATARLVDGEAGLQHRFQFDLAGALGAEGSSGQIGMSFSAEGSGEWRTRYLTRHPATRPLIHAFLKDLQLMPPPPDLTALVDSFRASSSDQGLDGLVVRRQGSLSLEGTLSGGAFREIDAAGETLAVVEAGGELSLRLRRAGRYRLVLSRITEEGDRLAISLNESREREQGIEAGLGVSLDLGGAADMARDYLLEHLELVEKPVQELVASYAELSDGLREKFEKLSALGNANNQKLQELAAWLELEPGSDELAAQIRESIGRAEDRLASELDEAVDETASRISHYAADLLGVQGGLRVWFLERSQNQIAEYLNDRAERLEDAISECLTSDGTEVLEELHALATGATGELDAWLQEARADIKAVKLKLEKRFANYRKAKKKLVAALEKSAKRKMEARLAREHTRLRSRDDLIGLELDLKAEKARQCLDWLLRGRLDRITTASEEQRQVLGVHSLHVRSDLEATTTRRLSFEINIAHFRFTRETILQAKVNITLDGDGRLLAYSSKGSAFTEMESRRSANKRGFELHLNQDLQEEEGRLEGGFSWDLDYYNKRGDKQPVIDTLAGLRKVALISDAVFAAASARIEQVVEEEGPDQLGFAAELAVPVDVFLNRAVNLSNRHDAMALTSRVMGRLVDVVEEFGIDTANNMARVRDLASGDEYRRLRREGRTHGEKRQARRRYSQLYRTASKISEGFFVIERMVDLIDSAQVGEINAVDFEKELESLNDDLNQNWQAVNRAGFDTFGITPFLLRLIGHSEMDVDMRLFRLAILVDLLQGGRSEEDLGGSDLLMLRLSWWEGDERQDELITMV